MVSKRRLGASMLLLGLAFVGAFHAVAAVVYNTGLAPVGAGIVGFSVLGLMVINLPTFTGGGNEDADVESGDD